MTKKTSIQTQVCGLQNPSSWIPLTSKRRKPLVIETRSMVRLSTVFMAVDKGPSQQTPPRAIREQSGKEPAPSRQPSAGPLPLPGWSPAQPQCTKGPAAAAVTPPEDGPNLPPILSLSDPTAQGRIKGSNPARPMSLPGTGSPTLQGCTSNHPATLGIPSPRQLGSPAGEQGERKPACFTEFTKWVCFSPRSSPFGKTPGF